MALTIDNRAVLAAADLYRRADKDLRDALRRDVNQKVNPWLRAHIRAGGTTDLERWLGDTARVRTGTNPAVVVGGGKKVSGGWTAKEAAGAIEFGAYNRYRKVKYRRRSQRGSQHLVQRATAAQIPPRSDRGRYIMSAVAEAAPMTVGFWVRTMIATYDAVETG